MRYLYWHEGEVQSSRTIPSVRPYVDTRFDDPRDRYGHWDGGEATWINVPLESFPKDFQMALILLGIT